MMCPQHRQSEIWVAPKNEILKLLAQEDIVNNVSDHLELQRHRRKRSSNPRIHTEDVWREKVTEWCYKIVDYLDESRDVVYTAMNILDRFLAAEAKLSPELCPDQKSYQISVMTALLMALKLRGCTNFGVNDLLKMSGATVKATEIVKAIRKMATTLSWKCQQPTPSEFSRAFLDLLPPSVNADTKANLLENSFFLIEVSVCDSYFSGRSPSVIAWAALQNAFDIESRRSPMTISSEARLEVANVVCQLLERENESVEVYALRSRLRQVYAESVECHQSPQERVVAIVLSDDFERQDNDDYTKTLPQPLSLSDKNPISFCGTSKVFDHPPAAVVKRILSVPPTSQTKKPRHV